MNWSRLKFIQDDFETDKLPIEYKFDDEEIDRHRSSSKVKFLFQIMYCYATHKRHKTQTHAMNARTVYEKFKSRELIKKSCVSLHQRVGDRDIISSGYV